MGDRPVNGLTSAGALATVTTMSDALAAIRRLLSRHPFVFEAREEGTQVFLRELGSGKVLAVDARRVDAFEEKESPGSGGPYLVVRFDDGRQIVLCHAGFGFAPSFVSTGPVPGAPQVVCIRDFHTLFSRLAQIAPDPALRRDALDLITFLIALLDGARAAGLEVGEEERILEEQLRIVEASHA
jgi:hypothetical protein